MLFFAFAEFIGYYCFIYSGSLLCRRKELFPVGFRTVCKTACNTENARIFLYLCGFFGQIDKLVVYRAYIVFCKCGGVLAVDFQFLVQLVLTEQFR